MIDIDIGSTAETQSIVNQTINWAEETLRTPLASDKRNYAQAASGIVRSEASFLSAKDFFNLVVATAFELTSGSYKDSEGVLLYREGMYGMLSDQPMFLIQEAFIRHCREVPSRPSPCHILRRINGYQGEWDHRSQTFDGAIYSGREMFEAKVKKLKRLFHEFERGQLYVR